MSELKYSSGESPSPASQRSTSPSLNPNPDPSSAIEERGLPDLMGKLVTGPV